MDKNLKRKNESNIDGAATATDATKQNEPNVVKLPKLSMPKDSKIKLKLNTAIVCPLLSSGYLS